MITHVQLAKCQAGEHGRLGRLAVRGLKLLALFTILNLGASVAVRTNHDGTELGVQKFLANAFRIHVMGYSSVAAFHILVPIGYLMVVSAVLLWACRVQRHALLGAWLMAVGGLYVLKWQGTPSGNLELLGMGLLGMVVGQLPLQAIDRMSRPVGAWVAAYGVYLVALTRFDVIYELQLVGLLLTMVMLYVVARRLEATGGVLRTAILLGQYSFLAYIAHIGILQVLIRLMRPLGPGEGVSVVALAATLAPTVVAIEATRGIRTRSARADRLYRAVFA